jgi:hypothetical protein
VEQQILRGTRYSSDYDYQYIIKNFNLFTDEEMKITSKTRVEEILICFMDNPDVIALWISDIPTFSILSLLKFNNDQIG